MTAKQYLEEKGINPKEPIFWYSGTEYLTMEKAMEDYAKTYANAKLDEAAEVATCSDASWTAMPNYTVDTESILKLKDKI